MRCFWNSGVCITSWYFNGNQHSQLCWCHYMILWNELVKWAFSFLNPLAQHNHCEPVMASLSRRCLWITISIKILAILMVTSIITTALMMPSPIGHFHLPLVDAQMFWKRWKRLHWRALMRAIILSMEELKNTNEFFWLSLCFARLRIAILTAMDKWTSLKSVSFSCSFFICSKGEKGFLFTIHPTHKRSS